MPPTHASRYERERSFHDDRFAEETRQRTGKYYNVDAGRARYLDHLTEIAPGHSVLEYGCGAGSSAFDLAGIGAQVLGIDISPVGVGAANARAAATGSTARFEVMNAEHLTFDDSSFDVVCGSGILHHLDLQQAYSEIARVLKPGGISVFLEPLASNPLVRLYRRLTPQLRTPDEHPLTGADLDDLGRRFINVEVEYFNLFALAAAPISRWRVGRALARWLHRLDGVLFRLIPPSRRWAWVAVIRARGAR